MNCIDLLQIFTMEGEHWGGGRIVYTGGKGLFSLLQLFTLHLPPLFQAPEKLMQFYISSTKSNPDIDKTGQNPTSHQAEAAYLKPAVLFDEDFDPLVWLRYLFVPLPPVEPHVHVSLCLCSFHPL